MTIPCADGAAINCGVDVFEDVVGTADELVTGGVGVEDNDGDEERSVEWEGADCAFDGLVCFNFSSVFFVSISRKHLNPFFILGFTTNEPSETIENRSVSSVV
jgi:hypothetical protein